MLRSKPGSVVAVVVLCGRVVVVLGVGVVAAVAGVPFGFYNMRAELFWRLREALDPAGKHRLALPPDKELEAELAAHHYELTAQ